MSILDSTNSGRKALIKKWIENNNIKCDPQKLKEPDYIIDVVDDANGDVNLIHYNESELPSYIRFGEISGNFICSYSKLTSMRGFPKKVGKNFDISFSRITSLEDAPTEVNNFVACGLPFTEQQIREQIQKMEKEIKGKVYC